MNEGFKRIVLKAGIDPMMVQGKGTRNFSKRTFHSLRHSFYSALANAGVSEEIRMKLTGHSSKGMNTRYTHLEVGTLKTAMTSLPLFGPGRAKTATRILTVCLRQRETLLSVDPDKSLSAGPNGEVLCVLQFETGVGRFRARRDGPDAPEQHCR